MAVTCAECHRDNPDSATFCGQCGGRLAQACTQCGEFLPADAKYCLQCGQSAAPSTPAAVTESEPERRHLTMLFCDLVGSTAIAERLDPEDWRDTVVRFQQEVIGVIEQAGGYVAQHLGDGLLVYFGYPRASEDDAERALRCGLALVRATRALNPELKSLYQVELSLRVGVDTGPVVVGEVGGTRRETLALGSTANVAARVQGAAEPNTVVVTDATLQRVRQLFVTEDLGEHSLKGIQRPTRLHLVKQPSGTLDRFERTRHGLTPLIGRERELTILDAQFLRAKEGVGQTVLIRGEAGIGKSRLVHAFHETVARSPHVWHECHAAAHSRDSPLRPWLQLQQELTGIAGSAPPLEKLHRLESAVTASGLDPVEAVPLFAVLHDLPVEPPYELPELSPLGLRKRTLSLLAQWVLSLSRDHTVVLLIEDLHWLDPSSLELIGQIMHRAGETRLLLLLTCRPGFEPPWDESQPANSVELERLDEADLRELIVNTAQEADLSDAAIRAIATRSDGVPVFAEELVRTVTSSNLQQDPDAAELALPDSLEDSLMARLEQIGSVKAIAQLASVLDREFPIALLEGLWNGEKGELRSGLLEAERSRVLLRVDRNDGPHYFFGHALIRDAAYNSLLRKTRRRHHSVVSELLNEQFPEVVHQQPEVLAHHLTEAQERDPAIAAWQKAGAVAIGRAAYEEAISHLKNARALLADLADDPRSLDVEQMLGGALVVARGWSHEETREAWEAALRLCDADKEPLRAGAITCGLGDNYGSVDMEKSLELFESLVEDGRRKNLPLLTIAGHQGAAVALRYFGRYEEARKHLDRGLELYDPESHHFVEAGFHEEKGVNLLSWSAWLHWDLGALDLAQRDAARGMEQAQRLRNPFAMALAGTWAAITESFSCNWLRAVELGEQAANLSAEQGFVMLEAMSRFVELSGRGIALGAKDAPELFAIEIGRAQATGNRVGAPEILAVFANLLVEQGLRDQALGTVEAALAMAEEVRQPWCNAWLLTLKARALLLSSDSDKTVVETVEALLREALATARSQGARSYELRAATVLADVLQGQSRNVEGKEFLVNALVGFDEDLQSVELDRARNLLGQLA